MKEIEILVEVYEEEKVVLDKLKKFNFIGDKLTVDTYFYDPLRPNLKPNNTMQLSECLRLRTVKDKSLIAYKVDKFDNKGVWLYSDEYETKVESPNTLFQIFEKMGLKELIVIKNLKRIYKSENYEIAFEKVDDLGLFLEVEFCTDEDVDIVSLKHQIQKFIDELGLKVSKECKMGKPEMMLRKKQMYIQ